MKVKIKLVHIAAIGIVLGVISKIINVQHWIEINFNMISYDPIIPVLGLFAAGIYLYVLRKKRIRYWYLWVFGITALLYDVVLLYGVIETYGTDFWRYLL